MTSAAGVGTRPRGGPSFSRLLMEMSWPAEAASFVAATPWLRLQQRGDGHHVLVLPGFIAGDASTVALRWMIRGQGYQTHAWRLGRNIGPTAAIVTGMRTRLRELADRHQQPVSLVGWSLGGIYARALAREQPALVRQVISLGSPYRLVEGEGGPVATLYRRFEHLHDADIDLNRIAEQHRPAIGVPSTSIYSRRDGVARWETCIDEIVDPAGHRENIEVYASHTALGMHPAVAYAVLDRLRQPVGQWQPFRAPCPLRAWYPQPVSWRPRPGRRSTLAP